MAQIHYNVKHYYQPTNTTCGQSATAVLMSYYGIEVSPEEVFQAVPTIKNEAGEEWGTLSTQLALWCLKQGFEVDFYSSDFQLLDLSWGKLSREALLERMKAVKPRRDIASLGKEFSGTYLQTYIDFVEAGGDLHVVPYIQTKLIDQLLSDGPVFACVNYPVLHGLGRFRTTGLREGVSDDINGITINHFIVIFGRTDDGDYQISDPYKEPGQFTIEPEHLLCAITAAQSECENAIFAVRLKK